MGLLEDIINGKHNTILICVLFIFVFHQYWNKSTEYMTDTSSITVEQLQDAIKKQYLVDVEAIRNLSNVATQLQAGGLTVPGDIKIKGQLIVESGKILIGNTNLNQWGINANQTDDGTFSLGRIGRDGKPNDKIGLKLMSSADGSQNIGGAFSLVPTGTIVAWTGTIAPIGWVLCDGQNKTPDLRGKFILSIGKAEGLTERKINDIGGQESYKLTGKNIPEHTHTYTKTTGGSGGTEGSKNDRAKPLQYTETNTSPFGEKDPQPYNVMPPFYALAYIMKL